MADTKKTTRWLSFFAVGMFGFGFALVPLYNVMCRQLGINGKTNAQPAAYVHTGVDKTRTLAVEFLTTNNGSLTWDFHPLTQKLHLHPGEMKRVAFYAENKTDKPMVVQAIPSVSPSEAAKYLKKTECFCFARQALKPHQHMKMPVLFHLDPELPKYIKTITLSYTLFDVTNRT
jgi:cytochrome c oxidase assembly protein subunit 11